MRNPATREPERMFSNPQVAQEKKLIIGDSSLYRTETPASEAPALSNRVRRFLERWKDTTEDITLALSDPTRYFDKKDKQREVHAVNNGHAVSWLYETYEGKRTLDGILGIGLHDNRTSKELRATTEVLGKLTGPEGEQFNETLSTFKREDWERLIGRETYTRIVEQYEKTHNTEIAALAEFTNDIGERILRPALLMYYFTHPQHREDLTKRIAHRIRLPFPAETYDFKHKDAREMTLHETIMTFLDRRLYPNRQIDHTRAGAWQRLQDFSADKPFAFTVKGIRKARINELNDALKEFQPTYNQTHGILVHAKMAAGNKE